MTQPTIADIMNLLSAVADAPYDGRPCSHADGCHDHNECETCGPTDNCTRCPAGPCCGPWEMGGAEEHSVLTDLVYKAQRLLREMVACDCPAAPQGRHLASCPLYRTAIYRTMAESE